MKKLLLLLIIHFILSVSLSASTLKLSMSSSPSKLNPLLPADSASSSVSAWIFNGLLKYDKHGKITTELAHSYAFNSETELIFKLKKNILWHDKKPFTAHDVKFSYDTVMNPKVFTPLKTNFQLVQSVEVIDNHTLKVTYKKPYFKALDIWTLSIVPKHILENEDDIMTSSFNKNPIGTGSYTIKELKINQDVVLYANDDYFEGRANIDKIEYKYLPDTNTTFLFQKQHRLDVGSLEPLQYERQIDNKFKSFYSIYETPSFGYTYLGFNLRNKKFQNPKLREALSLAVNRQELIDILFFGHGVMCKGPFLPNTYAYNDTMPFPKQNLKKAKALLNELGFNEQNPFSFEMVTNTGNQIRINAAQILQHQFEKVGVKMNIRVMEWQAFLNTVVHPRKFETVLLGWGLALVPDAKSIWHSSQDKKGGFNLVGYKNKTVDTLIEQGEVTVNREKLSTIYKTLFETIAKDNPYLFLYIPNSITTVNKAIKNIEPTPFGITHNQKDWIKP